MNLFEHQKLFSTTLAMAFAAAAMCVSGGQAYAAGVQVNIGPFNADDILRYSGTFTSPGISYDDPASGGSVDNWLVTQSAATQLATNQGILSPPPVGINDNGFYPASGARLYDVQLGFTNGTASGTNTVIRSTAVGNFSFNVPNNQYSQFAIFGSGGSGTSTLVITMNYSTGSPTVLTGVTLPDWAGGDSGATAASAAGTHFTLTPPMSRQSAWRFPSSGYQAPGTGGYYIYGINLAPDSTRILASVTVAYTPSSPGYTVANFFTAAGAIAVSSSPSVTPLPNTLILLLAGLGLLYWIFSRRQRAASGV